MLSYSESGSELRNDPGHPLRGSAAGPPKRPGILAATLEAPGPAGVFKLVANAALMASAFVAIKLAVQAFLPVQVAALRTAGAAVAVALWMAASGSRGATAARGYWASSVFVGLVGYALPFVLVAWAEQRLPSALAGLLMSAGPLAAAALAPLLARDERLNAGRLLGLGLGTLGVLLALAPGLAQEGNPDTAPAAPDWQWPRGLAVVGAAVAYALAGFAIRRIPLPPDVITRRALIVAALALGPPALLLPAPSSAAPGWPAGATLALVYLALVPTAFSYVVRFRLIVRHGYTFVSFTGYLVPVFSVLFGALLLGEQLGILPIAALGLIVLGVGICQRSARPG